VKPQLQHFILALKDLPSLFTAMKLQRQLGPFYC
jgi:hypothetical protein